MALCFLSVTYNLQLILLMKVYLWGLSLPFIGEGGRGFTFIVRLFYHFEHKRVRKFTSSSLVLIYNSVEKHDTVLVRVCFAHMAISVLLCCKS